MSPRETAFDCLVEAKGTASRHRRAVFVAMAEVWLKIASRDEGAPVTADDVFRVAVDRVSDSARSDYRITIR